MASVFETLNAVNVNDNTEKKNGLTYLSWAWAWAEIKKVVPNATYTIYERETEHGPVNYFTDGRTCWVKTGVTLDGLEHIEELPVMDFKNKSIPLNAVTSMDVNKTIQRSLTKACARHGLGLYIYAGEDLPEAESDKQGDDKPESDIPRSGSAEAAQEAGQRKLKQVEGKLKEVGNGAPGPATEEQKQIIKDTASDEDYLHIMQKYGANLETLSERVAGRVIKQIRENNEKAAG